MKISWIIQSNILTSSAVSSARGSDWWEQLRRPCLLSKTKRTGSVFLWSLLREHLLFVFPFTHSNLPAALPCVKVSFNPEEEAEHAFTVGMFGASACMAVRAGIVRWTAAKVISCLPHPLFPASCWQGTHSRGINEISRLLLPLPYVNLSPFLSGRQPCRPSVANPAQAGLGRTIDTHTLKYFAVCALFSVLRECVAHVCSLGSEVEAANLSRGHPGRNNRRKAVCYCCFWICPTFSSLTCASSSAINRLSGTGSSFLSCSSLRSTIPLNEAIGICASVALIPGPRVFYCACQWWVTDELRVHCF